MMTSSDRHGNTKTKTTSMRMSLVAALILVLGGGFLLATLTMQQPQHRLLQRSHEHDDITGEDNFRLSLHGGHDGDAGDDDDDADDDAIVKDHKRRLNPIKKLDKLVKKWKNRADELAREVTSLNSQVASLGSEVNYLKGQVNHWKSKIDSIPKVLKNEVVDPILSKLDQVQDELPSVDEIVQSVADGALDAIKSLDFLPINGDGLAKQLAAAMKGFLTEDNCIPYSCLAETLSGIDIGNIELLSSDTLNINAAVTPKTCLQLTSIEFDGDALGGFLDIFRDQDILDGIYKKVGGYLVDLIRENILNNDKIGKIVDEIQDVAKGASNALNLGRRRHLTVTEDVAAMATMAYEKGTTEFNKLYEDYISSIFLELNLAQNADKIIVFKSLEFKLTQDFTQTFKLEAQGRAGFTGSLFDESTHQSAQLPVPLTGNMVNIVTSGSMEGSMPYAMATEGSATAEFVYRMGEAITVMDMLSGKVTSDKLPSNSQLEVEAQVGVSATMALNFAASTTVGICIGPSENACVKVTINLSQSSAAGFDALAVVNTVNTGGIGTKLTTLYTDVLEYDNRGCRRGDNFCLCYGYWQYVEVPSATVAILGEGGCSSTSDILFQHKGGFAAQSIRNFCVSI